MRRMLLTGFSLGLFLMSWAANAQIPTNGLIAWYPFSGNANDSSGNGNNGVNNGAIPATDRFGNAGQAYSFDGTTSFVDLGDLGGIGDATYSIWMKASSLASSAMLFGTYGSNNAVFFLRYNDSGYPVNKLDYLVSTADQNTRWGYGDCSSLTGAWHHVAFTRTNATVGIYVDGSPVSIVQTNSQGTPNGTINTSLHIYVGANAGTTPPYAFGLFAGSLDDVRIYNRVLSTTEISALYHEGGYDPSLVAYYPFNGNANDLSGNNQSGTVYNATLCPDRFGNANSAYQFDGSSSYIDFGQFHPSTPAFTISYWMKPGRFRSVGGYYGNNGILGDAGDAAGVWFYQNDSSFYFNQQGTNDITLRFGLNNSEVNSWIHVVGVYNQGSGYLYMNGKIVDSIAQSATIPSTGYENFKMGRDTYLNTGYWAGALDNVRIYSRALGTTEVDSLYHEGGWNILTWQYQLKAVAGSAVDDDNYIGLAFSATDGFDTLYDIPKPPAPAGNYVQLYFPHPEYSLPTGDNLSQDIRADRAIGDTTVRWQFEVKTNFDTMVTVEAVPDGKLPPKIKTLLRDLTGGTRSFLKPGSMTYSFKSGVGTNVRRFEILIGDSLAPSVLVLNPNGGEIVRSGKNYSISFSTNDRSGIDTSQVFYSLNGGTGYANVSTIPGNISTYSWSTPSQYLNYGGSIKIVATDSMGNSASDASDHVFTIVGDSLAKPFAAGWSLVGLPLKPVDSTSASVFGDDISQQFYLFNYTPSGGYLRSSVLTTGTGYWLGLLSNCTLDVTGTPYADSLSIPLTKGWNIISNPLAVPIPKENLIFRQSAVIKNYADAMSVGWIATGLQTYQPNAYINQDTLQLWNGYWLSVLQDNVSMVAVPPVIATVPAQNTIEKTQLANPFDWQVSVVTSYASTKDQTLRFGVKPDATAGFDSKYDEPKAPAPPVGKYVESYFDYPNWVPTLGNKFNADIRNPNSQLTWSFYTAPSDSGMVSLAWTVPASVPDSIRLQLLDGTTTIDMKKQSSYSFATGIPRRLQINAVVTSVKQNIQLPMAYALDQNYPNPFNPSTTIQYSLPFRSNVRLEVFNVLGQRVALLYDSEQEAGYQRIQWVAGASTGIYIYRLEAVSIDNPNVRFTQVRKMLLLK